MCNNNFKNILNNVNLNNKIITKDTLNFSDEILYIINSYLMYKDNFTTYKHIYIDYYNIGLTCKQFKNIFFDNLKNCKILYNIEKEIIINKVDIKLNYGLTDRELSYVPNIITNNNYLLINIKDTSLNKYGSYKNYLIIKNNK